MNEGAAQSSPTPHRPTTRPASHRFRWLPWAGAVLLVALILAGLWPKPVPVELALVTTGPLRSSVNEEGRTRIQHRYLVAAPVAGQLRRIPHKPGAEVQEGQTILAVIDPIAPALLDARTRALAEAARDQAAAQLERAQAASEFAGNERRRFEALFASQSVSAQELEAAQMRDTTAARELAAARSALRQAEAELAEFNTASTPPHTSPVEVRSPATGRVLRVFEESARVVTPGTPLLEVGDPTRLEVVIEVLSRDGAIIAPGTRVELDQWGGDQPLEARVRLVEPAAFTKVSALGVEEQRVNVVADLVTPFDQRPALGDQFRVEARIIVSQTDRALKVPAGALIRRGDAWAAYVVSHGRASLRSVRTGRTSGAEVEILEGLRDGESVILYPGDRVRPEQRVKPIQV